MDLTIAANVQRLRHDIRRAAEDCGRRAEEITLMAAVKTQTPERIAEAAAAGLDAIGENRVQELQAKQGRYPALPLHFIGHLQSNKLKYLVGHVDVIQSVESLAQLDIINTLAGRLGLRQRVLLQVNIGREPQKGGFDPDAVLDAAAEACALPHVRTEGLMCIPPFGQPDDIMAGFFSQMRKLFVDITTKVSHNDTISVLSMGMSDDYALAIAHGSTMVRVGSAIFGARQP